nr:hypothetical protein [Tanacetum cinerariifolium]
MQTQTSNTLHNAIMEAGSKDRIDNDIYSTVDACPNACEMWKAIERLKQAGSKDRPLMLATGRYAQWRSRFLRYINIRPDGDALKKCILEGPYTLTTIVIQVVPTTESSPAVLEHTTTAHAMWEAIERLEQVEYLNIQDVKTNLFWEFGKFTSYDGETMGSYYPMFYKLSQELKTVSYHKIHDILKQHQNEVNEIRAERIARVANPLALVAQQQAVYHPQTHPTHYTQNSSTRTQQAATRNRGKAIDNEIDKLMALISLSFKKIYKPTNNNLRTSSNTSRSNQDNSLRINRSGGYKNQRIGNVAGERETVGSTVVQKSRIQCYNCKEFRHVASECQKPKRVKDAAYHREKMLLCKQEEARIQLNAEQADWRDDTDDDDELEDQELEAHYMYMA